MLSAPPRVTLAGLLVLALAFPLLADGPADSAPCRDLDGDGYVACSAVPELVDCAPLDWRRHPGAEEICNGIDDDCDGQLDEGCERSCPELGFSSMLAPLGTDLAEVVKGGCSSRGSAGTLVVFSQPPLGGSPTASALFARAFDMRGLPIAPAGRVSSLQPENPLAGTCSVLTAGERALVSWRDSSIDPLRFQLRLLDAIGHPIGPVIDLSEITGLGYRFAGGDVLWDGERFAIFWSPSTRMNELRLTLVDHQGALIEPAKLVLDDLEGRRERFQGISAIWTGERYVVTYSKQAPVGEDTLGTLTVSRDGEAEHTGRPIPWDARTLRTRRAGELNALMVSRDGFPYDYFLALLDDEGTLLDPPGFVPLPHPDNTDPAVSTHMGWNGELIALGIVTRASDRHYRVMWRARPDGTLLDEVGFLLTQNAILERGIGMDWDGKGWTWHGVRDTGSGERSYVACSCDDLDNDGRTACVGGWDCDDSEPDAHLNGVEQCHGLVDEDCDGFVDCADDDCLGTSWHAPIADLLPCSGGLCWSEPGGAQRYDLARGLVSELSRRGDLLAAECAGAELGTAHWLDDGRKPPAGDALWYLVRAEGQPCEHGSWDAGEALRAVSACH